MSDAVHLGTTRIVLTAATCSLVLTWLFWTAGAAAITAALGGGLNCR